MLVVTNRRLLFFKKKTVVGRPKHVDKQVALDQVAACRYDRPMVAVDFTDGSIAGLHSPRAQKPAVFVAAVNSQLAD